MKTHNQGSLPETNRPSWIAQWLLFLLLAASMFAFPRPNEPGLDASWRMALGRLFVEGAQHGRDVVFTYGPLGFIMGRTYSGIQFWTIILGQAALAFSFAALVLHIGRGLAGASRFFFYLFFVLIGCVYEDALHMMAIAFAGFALVRISAEDNPRCLRRLVIFLAVLAAVKFTNLLLAFFVVFVALAYAWKSDRREIAKRMALWFFGAFLVVWILCRQNPLWIPSYVLNSLQISKGYENAMGLPPLAPGFLPLALTSLALLASYTVFHFAMAADKFRAAACTLILWAFLYLNWKHGFLRADGHVIGYYICALGAIAGFPWLMGDVKRGRWFSRLLLLPAAVCCVLGLHLMFPTMITRSFGLNETKLTVLIENIRNWKAYRAGFDRTLEANSAQLSLPRIKKAVQDDTVDILGFDQSIAFYNGFNYRQRPVFQSYSAYTPKLDRINRDFYLSPRAPTYVISKLESIDERLLAMDDASVLLLLPHLYDYLFTQRGTPVWKIKPAEKRTPWAEIAPKPIETKTVRIGEFLDLGDLSERDIWVSFDINPTLRGRLLSFLYKPPLVKLLVEDTNGQRASFRLPTLIAKTGFILNPLMENVDGYTDYATGGKNVRRVKKIAIEVAVEERSNLQKKIQVHLSSILPIPASTRSVVEANIDKFWMFATAPVETTVPAATPVQVTIDNLPAMILHAPSSMTFNLPENPARITGQFGFIPSAYENGGQTDGALYRVIWTNGTTREVLFERLLRPRDQHQDRGLQPLDLDLTARHGGQLILEVEPGPNNNNSWDWTAWTRIEIK